MKALTYGDAGTWCRNHAIDLDVNGKPIYDAPGFYAQKFAIPDAVSRLSWFSRRVETALRPWGQCLLWCETWGVWESNENWHLYYRLRESYGVQSLIDAEPCHLFLDFEVQDAATFVQLSLLFGWDFFLVTSDDYVRVSASHNGWIGFAMKDDLELAKLRGSLTDAGIALVT